MKRSRLRQVSPKSEPCAAASGATLHDYATNFGTTHTHTQFSHPFPRAGPTLGAPKASGLECVTEHPWCNYTRFMKSAVGPS